jgi:hypothetical protein
MQVSHSPDRIAVRFDDDHAVADAGLILPASLAEGLLLRELFDTTSSWETRPARPTPVTRP